jgi:hypothetical protein
MIVLPIIGAITAAQVGIWAIGGAVAAGAGVIVRKFFKAKALAESNDRRLNALEGK